MISLSLELSNGQQHVEPGRVVLPFNLCAISLEKLDRRSEPPEPV